MPTVDFVYDADCPNVKQTRANLMQAFSRVGITATWIEHQIGAARTPARVHGYGSPTILVDGIDVAGLEAGSENCCRVYASGGAPDVELIAAGLEAGKQRLCAASEAVSAEGTPPTRSRWKSTVAVLPGIGVALMPKVVCPLCWPAYAGVLSAAGLTFFMEDRWLLPMSTIFLVIALAALAWRARCRRGYGPLALGAGSSAAILIGKFAMDHATVVYFGIASLLAACLWNAWPKRMIDANCRACTAPKLH